MSLILNGTTGISDVDGTAAAPALTGTDSNTGIFFPAADTIAFSEGGVEAMRIDSSGNVLVGTTTASSKLTVNSEISIGADNDNRAILGYTPSRFYIGTRQGGTNFFDTVSVSSGNLLVNTTTAIGTITTRNTGGFTIGSVRTGTGGEGHISFRNANGEVGSIQTSGSSTSYNTSSDYRLKEAIAPMTGALAKVAALKPVTYKWKVDGSDGQGFIAHELAEVVAGCVTGEKDATETVEVKDENGNITGTEVRPVYQGIDTSFLVATLTAAIQEQQATIVSLQDTLTALTTRITALEAI